MDCRLFGILTLIFYSFKKFVMTKLNAENSANDYIYLPNLFDKVK